jgi:hypothetical protein
VDIVTAQQYAGYTGFGEMPMAAVEELQKALTAGTGTDSNTFTNGRSLVVESLEQTLMTTTFSADDIVFWKMLKTNPVYAVVDEWVSKDDYGQEYGVAVSETGMPAARDTTYARHTAQVKFYRIQRELSHVITLTRSLVDAEAEEQIDGTMIILRAIEKGLFFGDSSILPTEFDGLKKQILGNGSANTVIDVRGPLAQSHLQNGAEVIRENYGIATDLFISLKNQLDIDRLSEPNQRVQIPLTNVNGGLILGAPVEQYRSSFGTFKLHPDVFITEERKPLASPTPGTGVPAAPTTVTATAGTDAATQFTGADLGTYWYGVSYFTASGESVATFIGSAVTVAAGQSVTVTMNGGTTGTVSGAKLFRSKVGAANTTDMLEFDRVAFTGTGQTYVDRNALLPGSSDGFLCNLSPNARAISWQQLLPLMKLPLAIVGPSIPFLIMLYGYLRCSKPKQFCLLRNIRPSDHRFNP